MSLNTCIQLAIRKFGTSSITNQLIKPPLQIFGLDGKYATAIYSAAMKQKNLDTVEKELLKFQISLKTDTTLREFMFNPTIKKNLKAVALAGISKKLSLSSVTSNLLGLLAENGRLKNYDGIVNAFEKIMSVCRGDMPCVITSAKPLDDGTKEELQSTLQKFAKKGENISIDWKVDPSLVGGLIVGIGDRYVDMSIASKIHKYSEILKGA